MGFLKNLLTNITTTKRVSTVQMVQERGNGFYSYNGKMYQSDIVRACIRPKIKAIGKLTAKHIRRPSPPRRGRSPSTRSRTSASYSKSRTST